MIKPYGARILIQRDEAVETQVGGIYIAQASTEAPNTATVVDVGNLITESDLNISVGDIVMTSKDAGVEVEHENVKYSLIELQDILATIKQ
jgi:chaperonin GroES